MTEFTVLEKLTEVRREIRMRLSGYAFGRGEEHMTPSQRKQIAIMRSIEADYAALARKEELPL